MKYLSSQPFSVSLRTHSDLADQAWLLSRDEQRSKPHQFENGGHACGLCGLAAAAVIHRGLPLERGTNPGGGSGESSAVNTGSEGGC